MIFDGNSSMCVYEGYRMTKKHINLACFTQLSASEPSQSSLVRTSGFMNKSQLGNMGDAQKDRSHQMDNINFIPTQRNTATRDHSKKKWYKTFISYEYALRGQYNYFYQDKTVHDKTFIPIWVLAFMAYLCVIILIVIAMYLYE